MTLKRVPGNPILTGVSIDIPWKAEKADPNHYYEALGLSPFKPWLMSDIQVAFRTRVKMYHPDGSIPNVRLFQLVQAAYEVLGDPQKRAEYDEMEGEARWVDQRLVDAIHKKLAQHPRPVDLKKAAINQLERTMEPPVPPGPEFDTPAFYYDTDEAPDIEHVKYWVDRVRESVQTGGYAGREIKLGFTQQDSFVLSEPWGRILMLGPAAPLGLEQLIHDYYTQV